MSSTLPVCAICASAIALSLFTVPSAGNCACVVAAAGQGDRQCFLSSARAARDRFVRGASGAKGEEGAPPRPPKTSPLAAVSGPQQAPRLARQRTGASRRTCNGRLRQREVIRFSPQTQASAHALSARSAAPNSAVCACSARNSGFRVDGARPGRLTSAPFVALRCAGRGRR